MEELFTYFFSFVSYCKSVKEFQRGEFPHFTVAESGGQQYSKGKHGIIDTIPKLGVRQEGW